MVAVLGLALPLTAIVGATTAGSAGSAFPLDPTFAAAQPTPGLLRLQLDGLPALASHVRMMGDGSAIVALGGVSPQGFGDGREAVAKLRPDGSLDTSFNAGGAVPGIRDLPGEATIGSIVDIDVDSHGRIIVTGNDRVTRLLGDGTPDPTFVATCIKPCVPGAGMDPPPAPTGSVIVTSRVYDAVVLSDDSIVIESSTEFNVPSIMIVTKLTSTGNRDLTFNAASQTPGVLLINDAGPARVVPQSDGTLVLVVLATTPHLHRVTAGGLVDLSYGGGTGVVVPPVTTAGEQTIDAHTDGPDHIVLEVAPAFPAGPPALVRIGLDGSTDTTFGTAGRVELSDLGAEFSARFFVQPDHRIIVEIRQPSRAGALARLTVEGLLDASFNPASATPGWLLLDPAPDPDHNHEIIDLVAVADAKLLAVGDRPFKPPTVPADDLAEIYRFDGFAGVPQPIAHYPMASPPPIIPTPVARSVTGAAAATRPAKRLNLP